MFFGDSETATEFAIDVVELVYHEETELLRLMNVLALLPKELRVPEVEWRVESPLKLGTILPRPTARRPERYMLTASLPRPKNMKTTSPEPSQIQRSNRTVPWLGTMMISFHAAGLCVSDQL